jgi:hypothetical protein
MTYLKKIFNFLSSIKLAIPVMLLLLVASVAGTLVESHYNAEYAGLKIYKTGWFLLILFFLWINILFAALSRIPWQKRHVGFLVTHLGMLTLLLGSVMTMLWGVDGTLQIYEKSDSNLVFLQNNVIEVNGVKTPIKRFLEKEDLSHLFLGNNLDFTLSTYLPFVDVPEKTFDRGLNVNFKIKSAFFDVVQVLNTELEKEVQMGPATFRLVDNVPNQAVMPLEKKSDKVSLLYIKDKNGKVIKSIDFEKKRFLEIGKTKFKIVKIFKNAQIANNKIEEGDESRTNPAIELEISQNNKPMREIIYQNIPEFTLNPDGFFGFKFSFTLKTDGGAATSPMESDHMPSNHPKVGGERIKNTVEFQLLDQNKVEVALYKNGEQQVKKILSENEAIVTPWMGMELTYLGIKNATDSFVPMETIPKKKMPMPPSAILLKTQSGKNEWITENSEVNITVNGKQTSVYYGRERLFLPFSIALNKFEKNDYPGSDMAMDYKSYVQINGQGPVHEIYMNEPMKLENYTFYQSSYQMNPNGPAITILSVNRDPGRALKYIGSIILCLGIILYTLQKSKRIQKKFNL